MSEEAPQKRPMQHCDFFQFSNLSPFRKQFDSLSSLLWHANGGVLSRDLRSYTLYHRPPRSTKQIAVILTLSNPTVRWCHHALLCSRNCFCIDTNYHLLRLWLCAQQTLYLRNVLPLQPFTWMPDMLTTLFDQHVLIYCKMNDIWCRLCLPLLQLPNMYVGFEGQLIIHRVLCRIRLQKRVKRFANLV